MKSYKTENCITVRKISIGLIIRSISSPTQYLICSTSSSQHAFDLEVKLLTYFYNFIFVNPSVIEIFTAF